MAPCILIVDDESDFRTTLAEYLVEQGLDVTEAADGLEALGLASIRHFDLIITDLKMPKMTGLEFIAALRQKEGIHMPAVVVVSGNLVDSATVALERVGVKTLLTKPFAFPDFNRALQGIIGAFSKQYNRVLSTAVEESVVDALSSATKSIYSINGHGLRRERAVLKGLSAGIPIYGNKVFGSMSISTNMEFSSAYWSQCFSGTAPIVELQLDMIGELCNQIAGGLKRRINHHTGWFQIGLPEALPFGTKYFRHKVSSPIGFVTAQSGNRIVEVEYCFGEPIDATIADPEAVANFRVLLDRSHKP